MTNVNTWDSEDLDDEDESEAYAEYLRTRCQINESDPEENFQSSVVQQRGSNNTTRNTMQNSEMDKEVNGSQDKILSPSDLNLPSTSQQTVAVSRTEENSEELKNVISKAQALAKKMASNVPTDQITRSLLKGALDKLVLAQNNILESEKSKLKSMQETDQRINNNQITQEVQSTSSNTNLRQNSQVMLGNQSLTSNINMRPKIQRSYKLTAKSSFEVWLDCLKTELTSWMLLYLVDSKIPEPTGISETETILRKNSVKDIIISHIDEEYHKKILGMTEPMEILQKLRESRKGEVISTPTSIRTKLYNLRMNKGEKVHKFCERFDQIVREHELSDDPQKLTDQEKRSTFYQAIIGVMPEIRRTDSAVITTTGKEMSMEALRKAMIRIQEDNDADIRDSDVREPTASRVNSFKAKPNKSKCYRCNRSGHWQQECPLLVPNRWFCYICNCETDHKGEDCPNKFQRPSQGHNKRPFNKTFDSSGPPSKRNKFTSSQHAHSKGIASFKGDRGRGRSHTRGRGFHRGLRNGSNVRRAEYNVEDENSALDGDGYDDNHECDQNQE